MRRRLRGEKREAGYTLIELLVGSAMGVVVMGAVASLVISAVRAQPTISKQAQNITTARWVLERMTRELRHSTCGGTASLPSDSPSIKCEITYECTTSYCSRKESAPGTFGGTPTRIFSGINSDQVFSYAPNAAEATYVKVTLRLPNPRGTGALTISDGASLRNATLGY
jgi:type II secretory pathway pseudopilin PulG